jgi:hypothetical protein
MRDLARLVVGAVAVLALTAPAGAQTDAPSPAASASNVPALTVLGDVVIRTVGRSAAANRWLWYGSDGIARFEGILNARKGRFRASVDPKRVSSILEGANLCAGPDVPIVPLATDAQHFRVVVRCPTGWRSYATYGVLGQPINPAVKRAVRDLEAIGAELAWQPDARIGDPPDVPGPRLKPRSDP